MIITKFHISNYRSLYDLKVKKLDSTTIFYGDNNAGKSNILSALYTIFKRKKQITETAPSGISAPQNFYQGVVEGFANNFFNNNFKDIKFLVQFSLESDEVDLPNTIREKVLKAKRDSHNNIEFDGVIKASGSNKDLGEIFLNTVTLDDTVVYHYDKSKIFYFPTLEKEKQGNLGEIFAKLIEPFNDCVSIIESTRDMHPTNFSVEPINENEITPSNFKQFLYSLYLSEDNHKVFEEINNVFNKEPFRFGSISFAHSNDKLEVMIKEDNVRLPIKHVGSGVLQTLYIVAKVIHNSSKIVCIEELEQNLAPKRQFLTLRKLQSMLGDKSSSSLQQILISSHSSVYNKPKLGTVYFLGKDNNKTVIKDVKELKKHLIDSAPSPETYTKKEWEENMKEMYQLTEEGFRR